MLGLLCVFIASHLGTDPLMSGQFVSHSESQSQVHGVAT
jgi:hypothetical protein